MLSVWGETVDILRFGPRKNSASLSSMNVSFNHQAHATSAQTSFIRTLLPRFTQSISPGEMLASPLIEHYFYPLSTAPTNNYNQRKFKKGNK